MYRLLRSSSSEANEFPENSLEHEHVTDIISGRQRWYLRFGHLSLIICLICTTINILLTARLEFSNPTPPQPASLSSHYINHLRRPSQYIRFDEINRPSPPIPKQFVNYPILLTQIDASDKRKVFEDDPRRRMTHIGTISPGDKRVLVTNRISTIFQFRAFDWGMESCGLCLSFPQGSSTSSQHGQSFSLVLYQLNARAALDVADLSYATRPSRASKLATIPLGYGLETTWNQTFFCETEELLTFELECSGAEGDSGGCYVDWWQNTKAKKSSEPGVYRNRPYFVLLILRTN
ncbi:hypothetical protein BDZ94DRAFT_1161693 [Collybia nuda]|uniref:Ubiquitin 3 binding protein But2 C-terminal domain-containing protein n=1 Tax=Collybia nuda TaxID=64659 RepID=A0A9P6CG15_9AGAR|nr:hypothetical protein BDZ94DRAFT_1161693 [Collybia nuda]